MHFYAKPAFLLSLKNACINNDEYKPIPIFCQTYLALTKF